MSVGYAELFIRKVSIISVFDGKRYTCKYKQKIDNASYDVIKIVKWVLLLFKFNSMQRTNPILVELVANRLTQIRKQHKHTKEYVAHNTGLNISDYENKAKFPTLTSIAKFCELYKISLETFFAGITYPETPEIKK